MRLWKYTAEDYRRCADEGLTLAETSKRLGVSPQSVYDTSKRHGITFVRKDKRGGLRRRSTEADVKSSGERERGDAKNVGEYFVDSTAPQSRSMH